MRRPRLHLLGPLGIAAIALALAGCGGSEESKSSAGSTPYGTGHTTTQSTTSSPRKSGGAGARNGGTPAGQAGAVTVTAKTVNVYGKVLAAGPQRHTVYMFVADKGESSSCNGACVNAWPPVTTTAAPKAAAGASASQLGTITRSDGKKQVTYAGHPLYFYIADKAEADVLGEGVVSFGAAWYALSPSGKTIKKP